jgi:hypothetical protein
MKNMESTNDGEIPTEVQSKLCSKACLNTFKKYREHTQGMCDNLKRLEQDRREYVLIVENLEEQIKAYKANELQHEYDLNYWKWEKKELELKVEKVEGELANVKSEFEKAKIDIEKYANASKAMDAMLKAQIHDKLKRGIGFNATPPPYNNNYIPPTTDLLEKHKHEDASVKASEIDPLGNWSGEDPESETDKSERLKEKKKCEESKKAEKPQKVEKAKPSKKKKKVQGQTTVVNPCTCQQKKPQQKSQIRGNQRNRNNQFAQKHGVDLNRINKPKPCFICGRTNHLAKHCYFNPINQRVHFQNKYHNSQGYRREERNFVARNRFVRTTPMGVSAVRPHIQNKFANPKKKAPVKPQSFLKERMPLKANKFVKTWVPKTNDKVAITVNAAKQTTVPKILTKYSSHTIPNSVDPKSSKLKEFEYVDANGQLKTTSAWVPKKGKDQSSKPAETDMMRSGVEGEFERKKEVQTATETEPIAETSAVTKIEQNKAKQVLVASQQVLKLIA